MQEYANKYSNVKLLTIDKNGGGPSQARNLGLQKATSEFVMFQDSDDYYIEDACEKFYYYITKYKADLVSSRYYINDTDTKNRSFLDNYDDVFTFKSIHDFPEVIYTAANTTIWNKIYRRDMLIKNNITYSDVMIPEDLIFAVEAFCKSTKTVLINEALYMYTINDNSFSKRFSVAFVRRFKQGYDYLKQYLNDENLYNDDILGEYIVSQLRATLFCKSTTKELNDMLNVIKPCFKDYSMNTRLVNNVSLPLNIIINCFVKLSSLTNVVPLLTKKILNLKY